MGFHCCGESDLRNRRRVRADDLARRLRGVNLVLLCPWLFAAARGMSRHQLTIRFADSTDAQMISRFNARLKAGGSSESIAVQTEDLVGEPTGPLPHRSLMIAEDGAEMRACVLLYHNQLYRDGKPRRICWVQMPLSEGLVDHAHNLAIVHLMKAAVKYEPLLISLGVGSIETQWGRFAKSLGWQHSLVPFFFLPLNVG